MSHQDEYDIVISGENALKKLEQLCGVLKLKWILLATGAGMLFYAIILIGIFTVNNVRGLPNADPSDWAPPPVPVPAVEYAEEPEYVIAETADESVSIADESLYTAAHDIGVQAGELFLNSRDTVIDFWNGFDEATGASDWARAHWDSGRERMSGWIGENFPPDDGADDNHE